MSRKKVAAIAAAISAVVTTIIETLVIGRTLLEAVGQVAG